MPFPEHLAELDRRHRARLEAAVEQLRRSFEQRVRAASEGLTSALAEMRAETAAPIFADADLAPIETEARQSGERAAFGALLEVAQALDQAESQGAVLDALLAGARRFAPRAGVLIAGRDGVRGWCAAGFGADADPLAGQESGWQGDALTAFAAGRGAVRADGEAAADLARRLGLPAAQSALLVPLVLRDRIAAALYVDRRQGEPELTVAAFQLIALGAAQRLELQAFSTRAQTPTLHDAASANRVGLPLWDGGAAPEATAPEAAPEPPPALAPAPEPAAEGWSDEAAGAVFELEPESAAPEPVGAELASVGAEPASVAAEPASVAAEPAPVAAEPAPVAAEPAPVAAELVPVAAELAPVEEAVAKSGIEELFEAYEPEPAAPPVAASVPEATPPPAWSGPDVVSWAAPELPAPAPSTDTWSAPGAVSWALPEVPPPSPPPLPEPPPEPPAPAAPEWQVEESEPTVFLGGAPKTATPPAPAREEVTSPFALPVGFETAPRGTPTGAIPAAETTAPFPVAPPLPVSSATIAVPTVARPLAPDVGEDATLLVSRPAVATPAAAPEPSEDATLLVSRPAPLAPPPPPVETAEPTEDQTHPSLAAPHPGAEEDVNDRTATRTARGTEVAPPPDLQGPGLAFTMSRTQRASGENALHEEARRLARLLVSEIKLYNEEQVEEGRRHRDLYLRLREDIDRSRQIYDERVHDSVRGTTDYFQQELVRSLAGGDPRALGI